MNKTLTVFAAAGAFAMATIAAPHEAHAQRGGAIAAGVIGGLAAGAIIGGAIAGRPAYAAPAPVYGGYAPVSGYAAYDGYAAPRPIGCPGGYWARRPMVDRFGNVVGYSRPRFFCP